MSGRIDAFWINLYHYHSNTVSTLLNARVHRRLYDQRFQQQECVLYNCRKEDINLKYSLQYKRRLIYNLNILYILFSKAK